VSNKLYDIGATIVGVVIAALTLEELVKLKTGTGQLDEAKPAQAKKPPTKKAAPKTAAGARRGRPKGSKNKSKEGVETQAPEVST
jgi:hypothetical protein